MVLYEIHFSESILYSSNALVGQASMQAIHVPHKSSLNGESYFKGISTNNSPKKTQLP